MARYPSRHRGRILGHHLQHRNSEADADGAIVLTRAPSGWSFRGYGACVGFGAREEQRSSRSFGLSEFRRLAYNGDCDDGRSSVSINLDVGL